MQTARGAADNLILIGKFAKMRFYKFADVAELADALDSGSSESNFMWVQLPSSAPRKKSNLRVCSFFVFCADDGEAEPTARGNQSLDFFIVFAEGKFATALRLVLGAHTQNGKLLEFATICSHFGELLVNLPSYFFDFSGVFLRGMGGGS